MDYISKEDAIDCVLSQYCASSDETEEALGDAIEEIKKRPAADVVERNTFQHSQRVESVENALDVPERNVGKWIDDTGYIAKCSACGEKVLYGVSFDFDGNRHQMNFCPNCGAKMEG